MTAVAVVANTTAVAAMTVVSSAVVHAVRSGLPCWIKGIYPTRSALTWQGGKLSLVTNTYTNTLVQAGYRSDVINELL